MAKRMVSLALIALLMLLSRPLIAETVYMASLEWPPYSGASLPENGAAIAVARAALKAMGHDLVVEFYPFSRTVLLVKDANSKYVAYLPEYEYEASEFLFSAPIGQGPLGLVENRDKPLSWRQLDDLTLYRIGVVQGYVNTKEFDELVANGRIKTEAVISDVQNILKVAARRVDAAVIDSYVLKYLLANDPQLANIAVIVRMNERLLANKSIHAAFKNNPEGEKWREIFDRGLRAIDAPELLKKQLE